MTIKQRHELQERVMAFHVINDHRRSANNIRELCAMWMRRARRLSDAQLIKVAASL